MMARLIFTIISTALEEAALAVIVLLGLPRMGINIPLPVLIVLMVAWLAYSVITYRLGSHALDRKVSVGLPDMVGAKGEVVSPLAPEGLVKIKGELWVAKSVDSEIDTGAKVVVVGQNSLKLVVRGNSTPVDLKETK